MSKITLAASLDLSNQGLTKVPAYVFGCRNLKKLNLSGNQLREIPLELSRLKQLKSLDLSGNLISQIYAKTFDLFNLRVLNLNNNNLKSLPKQIAALSRLTGLHLAGNRLESLPQAFSELRCLKELNISDNQLSVFPVEILSLIHLEKLWLGKNYFDAIPLKEIHEALPGLKAFFCFTESMTAKASDSNTALIMKQKGNAIDDLRLINNMVITESESSTQTHEGSLLSKKIFISYSHKDSAFHEEVETSIRGLKHAFPDLEIDSWSDIRLQTGDRWREEIQKALENAGIAILITSRHFLASDFIMNTEVPTILRNAKMKGTKILNLIAGKCIAHPELKEYQYLNAPDQPLNSLGSHGQDVIYTKLQEDLKNLLQK